MAGQAIREVYPDGKIVISNVRRKVDGSTTSYSVVSQWYDGTSMSDAKVDTFGIYSKYKPTGEYLRENLPNWGESFLEVDTMAQFRGLSSYNLLLLKIGYYKGVKLNGYHAKDDAPVVYYYITSESIIDNGGNNIIVNDLRLKFDTSEKVNVKNFGAKGDGVKDDTNSIKNAILSSSKITGSKGDYLITQTITDNRNTPVSLDFEKGSKIIANLTNGYAFRFEGDGVVSNSKTSTSEANRGDVWIKVSDTSGFLENDYLKIKDTTALWKHDPRAGVYPGELNQILRIDAPTNTIYLKYPICYKYNITNTTVDRINLREDVSISGLVILGNSSNNMSGLLLANCAGASINDAKINKTKESAISATRCLGLNIGDCNIKDIIYSGTGTSYGLSIADSRDVLVDSNIIKNARACMDITGGEIPTWEVLVSNNICVNPRSPENLRNYGTHGSCGDVKFISNLSVGSENGFLVRGYNISLEDNTIKSASNASIYCIFGNNYSLLNNIFEGNATYGIMITTLEMTSSDFLKIQGNKGNCQLAAIRVNDFGNNLTYYNVDVIDNNIKTNNPSGYGLWVEKGTIDYLTFINNNFLNNPWRIGAGTETGSVTRFFLIHDRPISTTQRPLTSTVQRGSRIYDFDVNKPMWFNNSSWLELNPNATTSVKGLVNQAAGSADTATAPSATYSQAEAQAILTELRDLKTKLRTAGVLAAL